MSPFLRYMMKYYPVFNILSGIILKIFIIIGLVVLWIFLIYSEIHADDRGYTESETVDIFSCYDGEKLIMPGSSGNYSFEMKNNYGCTTRYKVSLKADLNRDGVSYKDKFPIEIRVMNGKWKNVSEYFVSDDEGIVINERLMKTGETGDCAIEWRWIRGSDDVCDTMLGNSKNIRLTLYITGSIECVSNENEHSCVGRQKTQNTEAVDTGDRAEPGKWMAVSVCLSAAVFLIVKKKRSDRITPTKRG